MTDQDSSQIQPRTSSGKSAWRVGGIVAAVLVAVLAGWPLLRGPHWKLAVRTCLQDAAGLREGTKVRLAGVSVGYVQRVRAQPQDSACPAAVEMALATNYELKIPRDSVVSTATAGFLGETILQIDTSQASGAPIGNGGQLPSRLQEKLSAEQVIRFLQVMQSLQKASDSEINGQTPVTQVPNPKKKRVSSQH
jgi:ABC-type transporter Mla subunit MlaD